LATRMVIALSMSTEDLSQCKTNTLLPLVVRQNSR
jgi:hypothetical protein